MPIKRPGRSTKKMLSTWMKDNIGGIAPVEDPKPDDIIIPVMGPTGVGKSTFINTAVGAPVMSVGHDLQSCTEKLQHVIVPHPHDSTRRIVFVDTPGFDDTYTDDVEILKHISAWLAYSYYKDTKLAGIIYLHDVSQTRMLGTHRKNLTMFKKLCGEDALKKVILATTNWADVTSDVGQTRERQLKSCYWKDMLEQGSLMTRFKKTPQSAWAIVDLICNYGPTIALIQAELVDLQRHLPETEAGKTLRYTLQEVEKKLAERLQDDEDSSQVDEELDDRDGEIERLRLIVNQIQELKVPLSRRIMTFLFA